MTTNQNEKNKADQVADETTNQKPVQAPRDEPLVPPQQYFKAALPSFNQPYWVKHARRTPYPMLAGKLSADVVVIGGGITGLTAATQLALAGKNVVLIEMTVVGGGTTGHSTGHLDNNSDRSLKHLLKKFGEENGRLILKAKRSAIDLIDQWDNKFHLESRFKRIPGYLYTEQKNDIEMIEAEFEAARTLGLEAELVNSVPLPFPTKKALMFPNQARFSPLNYVYGLAQAFAKLGGQIYENTRAEHVENIDGHAIVHTNHGDITTLSVVLAGHAPLMGAFSLQSRNYPYQSYVLGIRVKDEIPDALYWDTAEPYNYTRRATSDDPKLLLVGGADHDTGRKSNTHRSFKEMERYARQRYQVETVEYRWSHEYFDPSDGVPYIGCVPGYDNIYVGTGYSGDGLTYGTAAGMIISHLILEKKSDFEKAFSPSRFKPISTMKGISTGVSRMVHHFVGDRIGRGDVESMDKITKGHGGVVVINGQRLAVFRDDQNKLHAMSPSCRHMGCIVHWNQAEKTWDCPCHGGRYDAYGRVIGGPPRMSLEPRNVPVKQSRH